MTLISTSILASAGELPPDYAAARFAEVGEHCHFEGFSRPWGPSTMMWRAPAVCHGGLIFEEVNLERYGYEYRLVQPVVSAAHFFGRLPALPYLLTAYPQSECTYTLGHYRPGSYAPYRIHFPRPQGAAALAEAGVWTGLIFLIP